MLKLNMKTELLASISILTSTIVDITDRVNSLPDDPLPPLAPTNMRVTNAYLVGGPLAIGIGWDDGPSGCVDSMDFIGAEGNPNGPQEWTPVEASESVGEHGEKYTHILQNPSGQVIIFRLRFSYAGLTGSYSELSVSADDVIAALS